MKTQNVIIITAVIIIAFFLIIKPSLTGDIILQDEQKIKLGYCPTMQKEAISLSEKNNYELIKFNSASEVLSSLNKNQIEKALIGRKAKNYEIHKNTKETTLESGYTLVSNKKEFINYSQLSELEIYTYLSKKITENLIPHDSKIIYLSKNETINRISEEKIVLISWKDWEDNFELVVVMDGNKKVKNFRGAFLYEN
jgi:hypothetical protein